jgi:CDP-glucose 4,6-dehydratase
MDHSLSRSSNLAFWHNKCVLVTGGRSFLGAHLCNELRDLGANVVATIDSASAHPKLRKPALDVLTRGVKNRIWDVKDHDIQPIQNILDDIEPEFIFHTIGLVNVLAEDIQGSVNANTLSVLNLFHAVMKSTLKPVVVVSSTDKVYGKCREAKEETPLNSGSLYQTTKVCGDLLAQMFLNEYQMKGAIIRSANFYGPYDWHQERLIPTCILSCLEDKTIQFRSDGTQVREYLYIKDAVNGFLSAAQWAMKNPAQTGKIFNLGTGKPFSARQVADLVMKETSSTSEIQFGPPANNEIEYQSLNWEYAQRTLDWQPEMDFESGLLKCIESYKELRKPQHKTDQERMIDSV